ncbi:MAG: alpha/beta hydrolase [Clostridia bacterium]|nr:alpha/beta hydrolase [Clostridia bacterium]
MGKNGVECGIMQLNVCGAKVDVMLSGEGQRAALLLHGWGCSAQMMSTVSGLLAKHMRVAAIDFPGHGNQGKAPEPPEPWGVPEYMEMTAAVIRELGLAPCDIVAHSFGARVAILLASTYPELVGRMILTGAAGIRKPATGKATAKQKLYKGLRGTMNVLDKAHIFGDLPEKGREALVQKFGSPDYRALTPEMRKTFNKVITLDLTDRLDKIQSSTLLYWGEQDTETPLWMGRLMEEKIPDAGLVVEPGCGHFAYLEQNAKFLRIVGSFLLEGR